MKASSKNSFYFLKRLSLFLLLLGTGYVALLGIFSFSLFKNKVPNLLDFSSADLTKQFNTIHAAKNTDILFIGSSHAEFAQQAFKEKGINSINLSLSSLRPQIAYYLLKSELSKTSAKVVVLESYYHLFNEAYLINEATLNVVSNEKINRPLVEMALSTKDFKVINSEAGLFVKDLLHPLSQEVYPPTNLNSAGVTSTDKGLQDSLRAIKPYKSEENEKAFEYFQKCVDLIKASGKTPVFIMSPVTPEWKGNCLNYYSICYSLDSLALKNNVISINYNEPQNYNRLNLQTTKDFGDANHLNTTGALKFSRIVDEDLEKLGLIQQK